MGCQVVQPVPFHADIHIDLHCTEKGQKQAQWQTIPCYLWMESGTGVAEKRVDLLTNTHFKERFLSPFPELRSFRYLYWLRRLHLPAQPPQAWSYWQGLPCLCLCLHGHCPHLHWCCSSTAISPPATYHPGLSWCLEENNVSGFFCCCFFLAWARKPWILSHIRYTGLTSHKDIGI